VPQGRLRRCLSGNRGLLACPRTSVLGLHSAAERSGRSLNGEMFRCPMFRSCGLCTSEPILGGCDMSLSPLAARIAMHRIQIPISSLVCTYSMTG